MELDPYRPQKSTIQQIQNYFQKPITSKRRPNNLTF